MDEERSYRASAGNGNKTFTLNRNANDSVPETLRKNSEAQSVFRSHGLVVRDARPCRAPHHEGLRPHPEERALARVSKDEATDLENALRPQDHAVARGTG